MTKAQIMDDDFADQTLEMMRLMDRTEELADCLMWTGAVTKAGYPIYKPYCKPCALVRRAMFELNGGVLDPRVPIVTTCGEKLCINPKHLAKSTIKEVATAAGARGAFSSRARSAKIAESKRKRGKLVLEDARAIRLSTEKGPALAARYGVNKSLINRIKSGSAWRDYSSHWAGLM